MWKPIILMPNDCRLADAEFDSLENQNLAPQHDSLSIFFIRIGAFRIAATNVSKFGTQEQQVQKNKIKNESDNRYIHFFPSFVL